MREQLCLANVNGMDWYEDEVAALERSTRNDALQSRPLFYGSSSFRLWDTLAADLDSDRIVNRAFGGSTLAACVHFFERLVLPLHPVSLTLYAGDNDLGDGRSVDQVVASFRELLTKVDAYLPEAPFAFLGIKPSPARWHIADRIVASNLAIAALMTARNHNTVFIDTMAAMLGPHRQTEPCTVSRRRTAPQPGWV